MERITEYDEVRGCYVIKPEAPQGQHIQRLGMYEDRDEAKRCITDLQGFGVSCPNCDRVMESQFEFCPDCGQRLKWGE